MLTRALPLVVLLVALGCKGDSEPPAESDTDTDTDTDSDADTDTDADADTDTDSDTDADSDTDVATTPTVTGTDPADGDEGVLPDATITLEFSEPMDTASVEAAIDIPLLAGAVTMTWPDDQTLVITPDADLPVLGTDVAVRGQEVLVNLGAGGMSAAGEPLAEVSALLSFRVVRSWSGSITRADNLSGHVTSAGVGVMNAMTVGDNESGATTRAVTTFDLVGVPPIVHVNQATVIAELTNVSGFPFTELGTLEVRATSYNVVSAAAYDNPAIGTSFGVGDTPEVFGNYSVDVTDVANDVIADPNATRIQLRYAFSTATNSDLIPDAALFSTTSDRPSLALDAYVE